MTDGVETLVALRDRLVAWAVADAFPIWATSGWDPDTGGFHEALTLDGRPAGQPRRARVQPRQIAAFGCAGRIGWHGAAGDLMGQGFAYVDRVFRRPDGLLRTRVAIDGTPLDEEAVTYDHAFALLARAEAHTVLGGGEHHDAALALLAAMERRLRIDGVAGFGSTDASPVPLLSNPHMHLLEACLAWCEAGGGARWEALADEIAALALGRMIDGSSGMLFETFDADWRRAAGIPGRIVEPGHQYEWAWLLLRWGARREREDAIEAALRLIRTAEANGLDPVRGVAYDAILDDGSVHSPVGRTWPQTERIKAGLVARQVTGDAWFADVALRGGTSLLRYLDVPRAGLYRDRMLADGAWGDDPVPASTFYHIVFAVSELARLA